MSTAIIITARLKSTRLPMKVIKPVMGKPMICHMLDRLKLAKSPEKIIICTSTVSQDDPLEEIAARESVDCFRGHPDDVLLRMTNAAEQQKIDTVVSCTADNPFVDPVYIDHLVAFHLSHHNDYSRIQGLPWGVFSYALSYPAMVRACEIKDQTDTEVWGNYFTETGMFRCGVLDVKDPEFFWPDLRLTVDTPEDFELIVSIFDELYKPDEIFSLKSIVGLCRKRPDLPALNKNIKQKPGLQIKLKAISGGLKNVQAC